MRKIPLPLFILILVGLLLFFLFQSRSSVSMAYVMSPVVPESMAELLNELDVVLAFLYPSLQPELRPGISPEELKQAEGRFGQSLHPDVRALYRWHNGVDGNRELFAGHGFYSLEDAVQIREDVSRLARMPGLNRLLEAEECLLVLFPDPAEDGYHYDSSQPYRMRGVFYVFREDGYYRYFPSLKNLIKAVLEFYENGLLPYEIQLDNID